MVDCLRRLRVAGFTSLARIELEPGRLTVLIGANGSGKSNVLRALTLLTRIRAQSLQRFVAEAGGAAAILHYGPKRTPEVGVEIEFLGDGLHQSYMASLGFAAGDRLLFVEEYVGPPDAGDGHPTHGLKSGRWESALDEEKRSDPRARAVDELLSRLTFFHFHDTSLTSALRTHARAVDDRALHPDGGNLAAYLHRLERGEDEAERAAWHRIGRLVSRVAPSIKALAPTPTDGGMVRLDWIDDQDARFGAHQLSDGTLRAIALITALAQPTASLPLLMCIDEPELGLHPSAVSLIASLARSVSRHTQVLFATQSTAFLDHFEPDEIVVAERRSGATVLSRPDADGLAAWLEDYSLSEVFEKGVIRGTP